MSYPPVDRVTTGNQLIAIAIGVFATALFLYALLIARDLLMGVTTICLVLLAYIMYERLRIERYRLQQLATTQTTAESDD